MRPIQKFTVGIQPAKKMFRVQSRWGDLTDEIFRLIRKDKKFKKDYFKSVGTSDARDAVRLIGEEAGNYLTVTMDNVIFVKDMIEKGRSINPKKTMSEFQLIWEVVNSVLNVTGIRRIGVVGESKIEDVKNASRELIDKTTKFDSTLHPAKFALRFEQRSSTSEGLAPDIKKDDFQNVIYSLNDLSEDTENQSDDALSFMVDYQRYYSPAISKDIWKKAEGHLPKFEAQWNSFCETLDELGVGKE